MAAKLFYALPLLLVLQGACAAAAAPPHIASSLSEAHLAGSGSYRWFGLRIYDAQLWVGAQGYQAGTAPFALDLRYHHAFAGRDIAERSVKEIEKLGLGSAEQRSRWLAQMQACFPDVDDGMHLTGVFQPGSGVRYFRDGTAICEIADAQFASAFFAIWLDPHTSAQSLRAELLGRNN